MLMDKDRILLGATLAFLLSSVNYAVPGLIATSVLGLMLETYYSLTHSSPLDIQGIIVITVGGVLGLALYLVVS